MIRRKRQYFLRDVGHVADHEMSISMGVCAHFEGLWPIAPGHQTLFYQAWTRTKTPFNVGVMGGDTDEGIAGAHTPIL